MKPQQRSIHSINLDPALSRRCFLAGSAAAVGSASLPTILYALNPSAVFLEAAPASVQEKAEEAGSKVFLYEDFSKSTVGEAPAGWTVTALAPALAPSFKVVDFPGGTSGKALLATGNGRKECYGFIEHAVQLSAQNYHFKVRFKVEGIEHLGFLI